MNHSPRATLFNKQSDINKQKSNKWYDSTMNILAQQLGNGSMSPTKTRGLETSPNRKSKIQIY